MQTLFCSKKLEKLVGKSITGTNPTNPADMWSAHLVAISGRKNILFTHKKTLYSILLVDILKKDLKYINGLFYTAFIQQLKDDQIYNPEQEKMYLLRFSTVQFHSTNNDRKTMGTMNNLIYILKAYCNNSAEKDQTWSLNTARDFAQYTMNKIPLGSHNRKYAKVEMKQELES